MSERPESKRRWDRNNQFRSGRPTGKAGKLPKSLIDEMRRLRAEGKKVGEISNELNVNYSTVSRFTKDVVRPDTNN